MGQQGRRGKEAAALKAVSRKNFFQKEGRSYGIIYMLDTASSDSGGRVNRLERNQIFTRRLNRDEVLWLAQTGSWMGLHILILNVIFKAMESHTKDLVTYSNII